MKRALSLMTVMLGGGVASADTTAPVTVVAVAPRTLATGAPACGNVMFKSYVQPEEDLLCPVFRNLRDLEELGRKLDAELKNLDIETAALTLPATVRPHL